MPAWADRAYADDATYCFNGPRSELASWLGPPPKHMGDIARMASDTMLTVGMVGGGLKLAWTGLRYGLGAAGLGLGARPLGGTRGRSDNQRSRAQLEETLKDQWSRSYHDVDRLERLQTHEQQLAETVAMERASGQSTMLFEQQVAELAADVPTRIVRNVENPYTSQMEQLTITWTYNRYRVEVWVKGPKGSEGHGFRLGDPLAREIEIVKRYYEKHPSTGVLDAKKVESHLHGSLQREGSGIEPPGTYQQQVHGIFGGGRAATSFRDLPGGERVTFWSRWNGETITTEIIGERGMAEEVFARETRLEAQQDSLITRYNKLKSPVRHP